MLLQSDVEKHARCDARVAVCWTASRAGSLPPSAISNWRRGWPRKRHWALPELIEKQLGERQISPATRRTRTASKSTIDALAAVAVVAVYAASLPLISLVLATPGTAAWRSARYQLSRPQRTRPRTSPGARGLCRPRLAARHRGGGGDRCARTFSGRPLGTGEWLGKTRDPGSRWFAQLQPLRRQGRTQLVGSQAVEVQTTEFVNGVAQTEYARGSVSMLRMPRRFATMARC
jgi:hypothetical protein